MSDLLAVYFSAHAMHRRINGFESASAAQAAQRGAFPLAKRHDDLCHDLLAERRQCLALIAGLTGKAAGEDLAAMEETHTASGRLRGVLFGQKLRPAETTLLAQQIKNFNKNWAQPSCFKAFVAVSFYYQPFEIPLQKNIAKLPDGQLRRYLHYILRQPHIMVAADEARYLAYYQELTVWLLQLIKESDRWDKTRARMLVGIVSGVLTFGSCYYVDLPTGALVKARAKIVHALTQRLPGFKALKPHAQPAQSVPGRRKLRLGIISRNIGDYTDTRALYALFHAFDPERYEIYWYSLDVLDPTTLSDVAFFRKLYGFIHKAVSLRGDGAKKAQQILDDDLDILAVGTAYSFGAQCLDQMLSKHLARVQVGMNAMVPGSSGFASYDYAIVPAVDAEAMENFRAESTENLKTLAGPLLWYEPRSATVPDKNVTRAALGIPKNAVVYCSGAAANKQLPGTLTTWLEVLRQVPNSYLLLYPFNPAWGGYFIGLTFLARLNALLAQYPDIDPARIVVTRQVTPDEGNRLIMLSDVYLGSFPHAGATSATLALQHGKPVVARAQKWLRSTSDPALVASLGFPELIGKDNAGVTAIAVRLGQDRAWREEISAQIAARIPTAPFFAAYERSLELQAVFDAMVEEKGLLDHVNDAPPLRRAVGGL